MRNIRITAASIIAVSAGTLFLWSVFQLQAGYAVASALLTASAIHAAVRGPGLRPNQVRR